MVKTLIAGLWVFAVTMASVYFGSTWQKRASAEAEKKSPIELLKLKPITVPVVNEIGLEGYVLAVLGYNVDRSKMTAPIPELETILQDESFRSLYGVEAMKYKRPRKTDLAEISKELVGGMNKRLGGEIVTEVLIEELSYIPKEKARAGRGG